ncbi:MAG: hypothetical protein AUJ52_12535 [Elusimicrobia bacterium CG1_02_63_36]|nr:MAG: hypothetical protein AUJ52_12535 [Elusimicrobia bacterium CG1_02_63_36]PIP83021.1 MAG: glycosyl transferase [Elusimicrobia bacterium CG22_combo_CG10-13_8_21_14_all_63_91]PJA17514.1 MAG: glycosyl transferase [Elusimicrobia bacterium CG_4_10_14_0_2_um_filter_63_34]PJB25413.1 MAG: glycosyl transferase [Elusimicrobia bacterium CG_4_9_14_3_um_filter_62_55]
MPNLSDPRVSVVIPAYNAAAFIEETLDTVAAQTYRDLEIVVVDDGSTDETEKIVNAYLERSKQPGRCIRQANKKIAGARNTGVAAARGELIALLDHDDAWFPNRLERGLEAFDAPPEVDLVCSDEKVTEKGRFLRVHRNGPLAENMYERLLFGGNALSPSAVIVRKSKIEEVGGFRENPEFNTVEDYDLWMRLSKVSRFRFIPEVLGEYHFEERGASRRIVYHHENLERLLLDHFRSHYGDHPTLPQRLRMRRRLAWGYRSALGLLMTYREDPAAQRLFVGKMLAAFPFDPKNAAKALLWAIGSASAK